MTGDLKTVGIVGAGVMGTGIMINCVMSGYDVVLCDRSQTVLDAASKRLSAFLDRQVQKGRLDGAAVAEFADRLTVSADNSALAACQMVIEAVFENLDLKRRVFAEIEGIVSPGAVLASNTSCLKIADIAEPLSRKDRLCGMHYFSPAEINPVVELIEGPETTGTVLSTAEGFLTTCRKEVIRCKDQRGFALNRFFCPYTNEATRIVEDGLADMAQIDEVAKDTFGLALGPFAVMNIIGTAVSLNAMQNLEPLGPFYTTSESLKTAGADNTPWSIPEEAKSLPPDTKAEIAERLTGAVLVPVLEILEEGTATIEAVDLGARLAFRFEKTPSDLMRELGKDGVAALVRKMTGDAP